MGKLTTVLAGFGLASAASAAVPAANATLRNWGSTPEEQMRSWPGDELVGEPAASSAKAVDVEAPVEEVWRWLVQIGQDRGGWYSYEWLENLVGLRIRNAEEIREEWQHLAPGDVVRMVPRGYLHLLREGFGLPVAIVEPPRLLVLREDPADMPWDAVWTFAVEERGPDRCRLVSHSREHREPSGSPVGRFAATAAGAPFELLTHVMTRKMLLTLRDRAERSRSVRRMTTDR